MSLRRVAGVASTLSILLLSLVFISPAEATVVNCGDVISTPNTTVVLSNDVGPCTTTGFGIAVIADNVTIDLNGHTITGDGVIGNDNALAGVTATSLNGPTANNVTVKNGTITKFKTGVYLEVVNNATVNRIRAVDNIGPDSSDTFGEGIQVFQGGGHHFSENEIVHNGPFAGIDLYGPTNNNTVDRNVVTDNNILDTSGHHGGGGPIMQDIGIWVVNLTSNPAFTTTNNTVAQNQVARNGLDGIQVANFTNGNFVRQNAVSNNGFGQPVGNGFRDGDGVAVFGSSNLVESNSVTTNGGNGIDVHVGGNPVNGKSNTIRTNVAVGNGSAPNSVAYDLKDENLSPPCDLNVWMTNVKITKNQACVN